MSDDTPEPRSSLGERILAVEGVQFDRLFALVLIVIVGAIVFSTPRYSEEAQLFPLVIGVPTLVMLVVVLLALVSDRVSEVLERFSSYDVFGVAERMGEGSEGAEEAEDPMTVRYRVARVLLWIGALLLLISLVGFLVGTAAFLVGFYRYSADQSWRRSILYSAFVWAFIYVMFAVVLNTPLYEGVIGELVLDVVR